MTSLYDWQYKHLSSVYIRVYDAFMLELDYRLFTYYVEVLGAT